MDVGRLMLELLFCTDLARKLGERGIGFEFLCHVGR